MIRYILYILCCVSLVTGLYGAPEKDTREARPMSGTEDMHFCTQTHSSVSVRPCKGCSARDKEFGRELSDEKHCEFLPGDPLVCRTGVIPLKALRPYAASVLCQFHLSGTRVSKGKAGGLSAGNYGKSPNKYYVYTLGHILI